MSKLASPAGPRASLQSLVLQVLPPTWGEQHFKDEKYKYNGAFSPIRIEELLSVGPRKPRQHQSHNSPENNQ